MLLGFISLLLMVLQGAISRFCIPTHLVSQMLPCKARHGPETPAPEHQRLFHENSMRRRILSSSSDHCTPKGQVPLLSLEALHQLHIFIFVLAVVHAIFCVTTMVLGGLRIQQWKRWEKSIARGKNEKTPSMNREETLHRENFRQRAAGYWRRAAIVSWTISFCKQFYNSVTKSDYIALRQGFIKAHCPSHPDFNFHKYMTRAIEADFKKVVGISAFLWMFVIVFLLLNVQGWHTYFWLSFLPLVLLLLVGAKLEHIITRLAQETDTESAVVKPSDEHFWFHRPRIVLHLIHFILFQNAFEIAFFFWIWSTYGFHSCIMEKFSYITPRLLMGVLVQVLCSYSTLPLYAVVSQMGSMFNKQGMFDDHMQAYFSSWISEIKDRGDRPTSSEEQKAHKPDTEMCEVSRVSEHRPVVDGSSTYGAGASPVP